ncbi:tyrosine-type recombinase/integrase [Polaromonas sp.]|uniref:tyrosine-type recombinase/integrase n=1 Tax=Polaromonas sp. TaxID=1869339 RepID=UPI003264AFCD
MPKLQMRHFRVRPQKSGITYYYFDAGGTPRREIPLGSDYIKAVREWSRLIEQPDVDLPVMTFIDLIGKYEAAEDGLLAKAASTQATYRSDLVHLRDFFSDPEPAPLDEIKPHHIKALLKWKAKQPTTANRLKRLFSTIFNWGRGEGFTTQQNPCIGVRGFTLDGREVDINETVYRAVWEEAGEPVRDAMDLAEAVGQRPGDLLKFTEQHIKDELLGVKQGKTKAKLRVRIEGRLEAVLDRIKARKKGYKVWSSYLLVNTRGLPLTKQMLRLGFNTARKAAAAKADADKNKALAAEIRAFWFYDLRAKAADDTAEVRGVRAATDLLKHDSEKTTEKHYLRRGKIVPPSG